MKSTFHKKNRAPSYLVTQKKKKKDLYFGNNYGLGVMGVRKTSLCDRRCLKPEFANRLKTSLEILFLS